MKKLKDLVAGDKVVVKKKEDGNTIIFVAKHQEYPFILKYNNILGICGVSFNDGKDYAVMIKGVDELQHILYGLQLDSNLKI